MGIIALANAVTDHVNAGSYTLSFTATRGYMHAYDLTEAAGLKVVVSPSAWASPLQTRGRHAQIDRDISIGVMQKTTDEDDYDAILGLCEELHARCFGQTIDGHTVINVDLAAALSDRLLLAIDELGVWMSALTLKCRTVEVVEMPS